MEKQFICIICPRSCPITVDTETMVVKGNRCIRGKQYVSSELIEPRRTLTTTVRIESEKVMLLPVKTDRPIKKENPLSAMKKISKISVKAPIKIGEIIESDFTEEGTNLISTKTVLK